MNQIKIYDVAGAAGVSLATVSRVLNHPEKVRPETRAKIERIIKELGYKPNLNAKGLASSKSTTVAVVVPELTRSSVAEMINGIADCAHKRGYLLRLFVLPLLHYLIHSLDLLLVQLLVLLFLLYHHMLLMLRLVRLLM